jgi:hypothetical protein
MHLLPGILHISKNSSLIIIAYGQQKRTTKLSYFFIKTSTRHWKRFPVGSSLYLDNVQGFHDIIFHSLLMGTLWESPDLKSENGVLGNYHLVRLMTVSNVLLQEKSRAAMIWRHSGYVGMVE